MDFKKDAKMQVLFATAPIWLVLIGLLAAIVLPNFIRPSDTHYGSQAANAQIQALSTALESYRQDVGSYPTTEQGLQALIVQPDSAIGWDGPYLRKDIPNDPWGHPYIYRFPGKNPRQPEIISYGADGKPGGEGIDADIVSE